MKTIGYTTIEQSRKLLELGIPAESADMYFNNMTDPITGDSWVPEDGSSIEVGTRYSSHLIPAWSLTALLELIPNYNLKRQHSRHYIVSADLFDSKHSTRTWIDNPIDAAVEMIIGLKENNYI